MVDNITGYETFDDNIKRSIISDTKDFNMEEWNVKSVLKDVVYVEIIDENAEGAIKRGSIWLPQNSYSSEYFRFGRVILVGTNVDPKIQPGMIVIYPHAATMGVVGLKNKLGKYLFLPESRIMGVVERVEKKEDKS